MCFAQEKGVHLVLHFFVFVSHHFFQVGEAGDQIANETVGIALLAVTQSCADWQQQQGHEVAGLNRQNITSHVFLNSWCM